MFFLWLFFFLACGRQIQLQTFYQAWRSESLSWKVFWVLRALDPKSSGHWQVQWRGRKYNQPLVAVALKQHHWQPEQTCQKLPELQLHRLPAWAKPSKISTPNNPTHPKLVQNFNSKLHLIHPSLPEVPFRSPRHPLDRRRCHAALERPRLRRRRRRLATLQTATPGSLAALGNAETEGGRNVSHFPVCRKPIGCPTIWHPRIVKADRRWAPCTKQRSLWKICRSGLRSFGCSRTRRTSSMLVKARFWGLKGTWNVQECLADWLGSHSTIVRPPC